ncbi:molybdopterin biosynthesis enzyme [Nocardia neocaledoniensis]|uniref:Molybdopterin molybdenumtransferase n=2 Tax=Nocardia neocaledoniensis TaxID=236511 RepID=A0A317NZ35_9NOCA|nr:NTP transferase domain-containing protein [Nocardia neocaledoniensis]PWV79208.1 molybdopterin biosynthesis enzyme [Nocardia neocaledoniensis]
MTAADAIVLAGGRASRMGGVDKPAIVIGGRSMLDAALDAVRECGEIVVVGPHRPELDARITQVREVPPGSGPVAAIGTGLTALGAGTAPWIVVLAADMPFLTADTVRQLLLRANESTTDAVFAIDSSGRPQYLVGVWQREALTSALAGLDALVNQPMKAIVPTETTLVELPGTTDCDTEEAVRRARESVAATPLTLTEARARLGAGLTALVPYEADLGEVPGAALAAPLVAAGALPRFDVSAMDGYAVCGDGPWQLRRDIGFAGGARPVGLLPGEAVRIATGAHVPDGTTSVLRDEFAAVTGDTLTRRPDTPIRGDIRRRGEDQMVGDLLAPAGTRVSTALRSAAASVEVTTALVRGPVRARIVMTGDEIRSTGPLQAGQTRDSIGPVLPDLLTGLGVQVVDRVHLRDTAHGFDDMLTATSGFDLLLVVGATGGGAADQLRTALTRAQARVVVPRLAMRPGGSTVVAELPTGPTVLGLPGNPFAAIAVLLALTPTLVASRTGAPAPRAVRGPLHNAAAIAGPVQRITPARHAPEGGWLGDPNVRTAHLAGLIDRDGLVIVPPNAPDGTTVEFLPLPA